MKIELNQDGKWCLYGDAGDKLGEYDSEDEAKAAMAAREQSGAMQANFLQGVDLKDIVTRDLASETEIQIALLGRYLKGAQEFDITAKDFADAERNFAAAQNPLPIDYEHNTFVKGAEAPAAGWVKKVINKGEQGLYAVVAWTKGAADKIRSGEYRFISPVFFFEARDTRSGKPIGTLLGPPALTNYPLIQGMAPVTAKRIDINEKEKVSMDWEKLLLALAIDAGSEEVTEDKAVELIKAKMDKAEPPKRPKTVVPAAILSALDLDEDAAEADACGAIMALKYRPDSVPRERYEGLEQQMVERDIADMIARACTPGDGEMEGKLYPHEREWAIAEAHKNIDVMRAFIKRRPKILGLLAKLPTGKPDPTRIGADEELIMKQMGVSRETYLKYNGAH